MNKRIIICLVLFQLLLTACTGKNDKNNSDLSSYGGIWEGEITTSFLTYDAIFDIYVEDETQKVLISSNTCNIKYQEVNWSVKDNVLEILMNDEAHRAEIKLSFTDNKTLKGTYFQYGETDEISFYKTSDKAANGSFTYIYPNYTYKERLQQLKDFTEYEEDNVTIPFSYDLDQRNKYEELIQEYDLDSLTKGYEDIDLVIVLLKWVSDNFKHNGNSGLPVDRDAFNLIDFYKENPDGINCRGLSILLSELLRVYGIPAKHITCMPKEKVFNDCHVVVHAYSKKLNQWIMLDPTFKLVLQNEYGDYINLQTLRKMLINNETLISNKDAGWNGNSFDMEDYREYMTKNTFRFTCATDFYFGAEARVNRNIDNMLIPKGYTEDKSERTTTSDTAFWVLP